MTTQSLPAALLKAIPDLALADTAYLTAYASLMLQTVETTDGPIADAHAQLILLNERLEVEVAKVTDTTTGDLFGVLTSLQRLRQELSRERLATLQSAEVADDFDRLVAVADAMSEVTRRAVSRECVTARIMAGEAA